MTEEKNLLSVCGPAKIYILYYNLKKIKLPTSLMSVETVFPDHQLNQSTVKWQLQTSKHFPKPTSRFLSVSQLTYKEKTPPTSIFFLQHTLEMSAKAARERPRISLVWNSCPSNQRKVNKHISGSDMTQAAKQWRRSDGGPVETKT